MSRDSTESGSQARERPRLTPPSVRSVADDRLPSASEERFGRPLESERPRPFSLMLLVALAALAVWVVLGLPRWAASKGASEASPQSQSVDETDEPSELLAAGVALPPSRSGSDRGKPLAEETGAVEVDAPLSPSPVETTSESPGEAEPAPTRTAPVARVSAPAPRPAPAAEAKLDEALALSLSAGLEALRVGDLPAARSALEQAASQAETTSPEATVPEVDELRQQIELAEISQTVANSLASASAQEAAEDWSAAAASYGAALAADPLLAGAREGQERAAERSALDQQLERTLATPERLTTDAVFEEARDLFERADSIEHKGPRLAAQVTRLGDLVDRYSTKVTVTLRSDDSTEVILQRVGALGAFESKQLELRPGRYTVIGRRPGYRDVRQLLEISPDGDSTFQVQCSQPIG